MSAPDGPVLARRRADIVEIAALKGRTAALAAIAAERGLALPGVGEALSSQQTSLLWLRPATWLVLAPEAEPGAAAEAWRAATAGVAVAVDRTSALAIFDLTGPRLGDVLRHGCRLDLDPRVFPSGRTASTIIAQTAVTLVALDAGTAYRLLVPSTYQRHFAEWLAATGAPYGLANHIGDTP